MTSNISDALESWPVNRVTMQADAESFLMKSGWDGSTPNFSVDFEQKDYFSAYATIKNDVAFVMFDTSVYPLLYASIGRLIAQPDSFRIIGDESQALPVLKNCNPLSCSMKDLLASCGCENHLIEQSQANMSPKRSFFLRRCCDFALDFILFHELAHHWYGHVGLLMSLEQEGNVPDPKDSKGAMFWHSIETEADQMASSVCLNALLKEYGTVTGNCGVSRLPENEWRQYEPEASLLKWFYGDLKIAATAYYLGLYWVFRLIGFARMPTPPWASGTHPHPRFRLSISLAAETAWLEKSGAYDANVVRDLARIAAQTLAECETTLGKVRAIPAEHDLVTDWMRQASNKTFNQYMKDVIAHISDTEEMRRPFKWLS